MSVTIITAFSEGEDQEEVYHIFLGAFFSFILL